jgi:hypothetical protein
VYLCKSSILYFQVDKELANRAKAEKQFNGIKPATSLLAFDFGEENLQPVDFQIYPDVHPIKSIFNLFTNKIYTRY